MIILILRRLFLNVFLFLISIISLGVKTEFTVIINKNNYKSQFAIINYYGIILKHAKVLLHRIALNN